MCPTAICQTRVVEWNCGTAKRARPAGRSFNKGCRTRGPPPLCRAVIVIGMGRARSPSVLLLMRGRRPRAGSLEARVKNTEKIPSRPVPFSIFNPTFSYLRKNMKIERKREKAYSVRFCGIPFFPD
jgi:hypothetical protein